MCGFLIVARAGMADVNHSFAAFGHGIARIDRQVKLSHFNLCQIGHDANLRPVVFHCYPYQRLYRTREDLGHLLNQRNNIGGVKAKLFTMRECLN